MKPYRHPRAGALLRRASAPWPERFLTALGAQPAFTDAVLGDLAEERARRESEQGALAARWWYAGEMLRTAPHLLWNAARHGGSHGRARAAAILAAVALVPTVMVVMLRSRDGSPASLVIDGQGGGQTFDGIVLNSRHPVQLAMRALDANGRPLRSASVEYRWVDGLPLRITRSGIVTCPGAGDAAVRASVGAVSTTVMLRCRPVNHVIARGATFVVGDSAQQLALRAFGPDGRWVDLLAGELRIQDSTVATLSGNRIRPVAPGQTILQVRIGDDEAWAPVVVYEPVRTLEGLRDDQMVVVAPVRLARGDTIRWPLPVGSFWLEYTGAPATGMPLRPVLSVAGPIMCMPILGPRVHRAACLARGPGASVRIAYPRGATGEIAGSLSLQRRPAAGP